MRLANVHRVVARIAEQFRQRCGVESVVEPVDFALVFERNGTQRVVIPFGMSENVVEVLVGCSRVSSYGVGNGILVE